jgi:tetratricopeptide (TPR) repeat protein
MLLLTASFVIGLSVQAAQAGAQAPASTAAVADLYYLFVQGRLLEEHGDLPGAIDAYRKALAVAPRAAEIHAELSGLYARNGRATEAITEGEAALGIDPKNREAHRILGLVDAELADRAPLGKAATYSSQALMHLEQAYAGGVRDPGVLLTLGRLYVQAGQYPKGIETINNFLLAEPGYPDAVLLLVEAYDDTGEAAQAISQLEVLVADHPDLVRAETWLAELYERSNRWKEAAAKWGELAIQSPRTGNYRVRRAGALINSGDAGTGRDVLLAATKDSPGDAATWYLLAQAERRLGNAAGAEDAARHITEINPKDPRGPLALAEAKAARKDYRGIIDTLDPLYASLSQTPGPNSTLVFVATTLADALRAAGEPDRAVKILEDTGRANPEDLDLVVSLASTYDRTGKFDQAERALRGVLVKQPDNPTALNYLGYMLADRGQKLDEAVTLIKHALAIEADNPSFLDSLGWAYFKQHKYPDAAAPLERAAAALPAASLIQDHLGELCFQQKRYREAADAWTRALDGDRNDIDAAAVTKKRDRARELAK